MLTDLSRSTNVAQRGRLTLAQTLPPVMLMSLTTALIWPALLHAFDVWSTVDEFSFGFFVLPVVSVLIWCRRRALIESVGRGAPAGLLVVIASLTLYLVGHRLGINALAGVAVSPLLWGMAVYLWGWGAGRVLAFPLGFLVFGLGLFRGLLHSVGFAMQGVTAHGAGELARAVGLTVDRDGLVLRSDQFAFVVAEQCSGMSSLVSLLALALLWTYVARGTLPARLGILLSVGPLVLLANIVRVTLVLLVAEYFGQETAIGFFHGASSLVLFGAALGGLLLVSRVVGCRTPDFLA